LVSFLAWGALQGGSELNALNRYVALLGAIGMGLPTGLLIALICVRRLARLALVLAIPWMLFSAYLWLPVQAVVATAAALAALVVLGSFALDWRYVKVDATRSRGQS
jgi:hypothetical protein